MNLIKLMTNFYLQLICYFISVIEMVQWAVDVSDIVFVVNIIEWTLILVIDSVNLQWSNRLPGHDKLTLYIFHITYNILFWLQI